MGVVQDSSDAHSRKNQRREYDINSIINPQYFLLEKKIIEKIKKTK